MKLKKNFVVYNMADEYMLIPTNEEMASFGGTVILNEVSAFLVNQIKEQHKTVDELLEAVLAEYDIDEATAQTDIEEAIDELKKIDVIEE